MHHSLPLEVLAGGIQGRQGRRFLIYCLFWGVFLPLLRPLLLVPATACTQESPLRNTTAAHGSATSLSPCWDTAPANTTGLSSSQGFLEASAIAEIPVPGDH